MTRREELIALIESWELELPEELGGETSLIRSGLFDSLALFNLAVWVEEQLGAPVDPTSFDLPSEWDTVDGILRFLDARADEP